MPAQKKIMGQSVPDDERVEKVREDILEPALPIIDAHHHLWIRSGRQYLMPEFVADAKSGHNIVGSVFAECHSMYRQHGPEELRSLAKTKFVTGCAAMADSGVFGDARYCRGLLSRVELSLGDRAKGIFEQHLQRSDGRLHQAGRYSHSKIG